MVCAEEGLEAVSVRAVVERAKVNLGAVTYHFGSKQGLLEAMFRRRVVPMNEKRLVLLSSCEGRSGPGAIKSIVSAFVTPPLTLWKEEGCSAHTPVAISHFLSRAFVSPGERDFLSKYYEPVRSRFIAALWECVPELEEAEVLWRYNLMVGALVYALGGSERMARPPEAYSNRVGPLNVDDRIAIAYMVEFISAGFMAPPARASTMSTQGSPEAWPPGEG
jgi:Transcriptional regulator